MPVGTGTLYVQHKVEDEEEEEEETPSKKRKNNKESVLDKALGNQQQKGSPLLQMENASLNVTQRQESLVVQYLAMGGHRHFSSQSANRSPQLACSAVHSGPGQLCFGSNYTQKADLILTFEKQNCHSPALILIHNYHEARVHYRGHLTSCPKFVASKGITTTPKFVQSPNQDFWIEMGVEEEDCCFGSRAEMEGQSIKMDLDTTKHDLFKQGLAKAWSGVAPQNVIFEYSTSTACHFFHGGPIKSCLGPDASPLTSIAEILESEFLSSRHLSETELQKNRCRIFVNPPSRFRDSDLLLSSESLAKAIKERTEFGFVTVRGGREARTIESNKQEARDHFGFCVQSYACNRETDVSDYTKAQVAKTYNWDLRTPEGKLLLKQYIDKQPPRTLNSGTFHCEETLSTSYLSWLMNERDFCDFEITHFLRYKFVNYWNSYLEPLLAARHEHKKKGNDTASTLNKLFQNSHYGRLGMESSNYDTAYLTTGENLSAKRKKSLGHLSTKHIVNLGLVRIKCKVKKNCKIENRPLRKLPTSCEFITSEAAESEGEEEEGEEEEEEDNLEFNSRFVAKTKQREEAQLEREKEIIQSFSDSDWDSSDNDDDDDDDGPGQNNFVDLEEQLILDREEGDSSSKLKAVRNGNRSKYRIHFLYLMTFSGKERPILNNIAGAVAVLSNSKKLFLGHINTMLECGDPKLCELCYIDTDSCIFSMTYNSWEDCLKPDKMGLWNSSRVMADEDGESSFHGQLKCEGIYKGGLFKTMKIYRLFDPQGKTPYYSRCKGVSRHMSNKLPLKSFDSSLTDSLVVTRNTLRPTPAGQIVVTRESRKLAVAFNFKRKVDSSGIHSFPVSFVAEC